MQINDDYITKKTEKLLTEGENQKLLLGKYVSAVNDEGEDESKIESYRDVVLPAARPVEDVAIPAYDVYSSGSINVGYLAYNSFNKEDNSELLQLSQFFKDKDITDLVIDLRYNAGGEMECPFASLEYSQKRKYKDHELTLDSKLLQGGVNLNLSKVYVLTSSTTAAASEMLINCLRPYMTVITIGTTTKGETVKFPQQSILMGASPCCMPSIQFRR